MWKSSTARTSAKCGDLRPGDNSRLPVDFVHNAPPSHVEKISPVKILENFRSQLLQTGKQKSFLWETDILEILLNQSPGAAIYRARRRAAAASAPLC
jgi:hypothetical protein